MKDSTNDEIRDYLLLEDFRNCKNIKFLWHKSWDMTEHPPTRILVDGKDFRGVCREVGDGLQVQYVWSQLTYDETLFIQGESPFL